MAEFRGPYQDIYEAAKARLRADEARQRGAATRRSASLGLKTSGVSALPQQEITRGVMQQEADIGARVGQAQEAERLQDKAFGQEKEMLALRSDIAAAADARARKLARSQGKTQLIGQLGGAGLGALGSYFLRDQEE
jgi:hypothetical protein